MGGDLGRLGAAAADRRRGTGGVSSEAAAEIRALKRRNAELEQTIEILKAATSFFVRESDPRSRR